MILLLWVLREGDHMEKYIKAEIEIIQIESADIITDSSELPEDPV